MGANQAGLFIGGFPSPDEGLWLIKNGAVSELTGIAGAVNGVGLFNQFEDDGPDFTQFNATRINGLDLFQGFGADGLESLWVTDGTAAGTQELLPNNADTQFGLLSTSSNGQPGFAVLNSNKVLFAGRNAAGDWGVWSTDGTSAGTVQVFAGNTPGGIMPQWFVTFGASAMFAAIGAAGQSTLWITDGTTAGTHEIQGITGFDPVGGLIPQDLNRLGGLVLFEGDGPGGENGLWVSDGTGAGTHELTNIANANPAAMGGIFSGIGGVQGKPDFTNYKGKAVFQGMDAAGNVGLWMTDGTAAGTTEIGSSANIPGAFQFFDPDSFIVYQGKVYFAAENDSNDQGGGGNLWVTDGTAAGTTQIQAPTESASGFFSNGGGRIQPSFTIVNGQLLFRGVDDTGRLGVWAFNGSGSPVEISAQDTINNTTHTPSIAGLLSPSNPLLQAGGTVVSWVMQDGQYASGNVLTTAASGWSVVGTGDLTGNGESDVVLQNGGTVVDWLLNNGAYSSGNVLTTGAAGWQVVGTGDFTGNGVSDLVLQNGGAVVDWLIKDGQYSGGNVLTTGASGWSVVGSGDFQGNGVSDVLLQSGGTIVDWIMQNGKYQSGNVLATGATGWSVVGTGDFTGGGTDDVLLQNGGTVVDWIMQDGKYVSGNVLTTAAAGWTVAGTGDYNADGTSDVLLQNGGTVVDWIIKNGQFSSGNVLSSAATGWKAVGTA